MGSDSHVFISELNSNVYVFEYNQVSLNEIIDEKNKLTEKLADIVSRLGTLETKETEINELISDISKALNEINENIRKFEFIEAKIKESLQLSRKRK